MQPDFLGKGSKNSQVLSTSVLKRILLCSFDLDEEVDAWIQDMQECVDSFSFPVKYYSDELSNV